METKNYPPPPQDLKIPISQLINHGYQKIALTMILLMFATINVNAQLGKILNNISSGDSYQTIIERMDVYLDSINPLVDSTVFYSGAGDYKRFKKFKKLWQPRINAFGSFEAFYQAQSQFYETDIYNYNYITENKWQELGPKKLTTSGFKGIGPAESITFFDNNTTESTRHMLATSLMGGLFYSNNFGESWTNGGSDKWIQSGCGYAVFHPNNHSIWYASSSGNDKGGQALWIGNGGIYRTNNAGKDWDLIADKTIFGYWTIIFKILVDPSTPQILYAATSNGIYKTENCELVNPVWRRVHNGFTYDIELKPGHSSLLYATSYIENPDNTGFWKVIQSTNYGEDWSMLTNQPMVLPDKALLNNYITLEVSKAKPEYLYCLVRNQSYNRIFYNDLSSSIGWVNVNSYYMGSDFGGGHAFGVDQITDGTKIIYSKGTSLAGVNINGTAFSTGHPVHVDLEDVIYHPHNPNEVWTCTHGGVEKSINGGQAWQAKYEGLGIAMIDHFATSHSNPGVILAGLYHDGVQLTTTEYSKNWNPDWKWLSGFYVDGMLTVIDHKNPHNMFGSGQKGYWLRSNDKFNTFNPVSPKKSTFWESIGTLNKTHTNIFYRNGYRTIDDEFENVFMSVNRGESHGVFISNLETFLPNASMTNILEIKTPFQNENYLYVYLYSKEDEDNNQYFHLFRTKNVMDPSNSIVWEKLEIPSTGWISGLDFDPANPDIVYLSYGNAVQGQHQVYRIDYSDILTPIFQPLTGNLPISPSSYDALAALNNGNGGLFFSTEFGVFFTDNDLQQQNGNEWCLVGDGLPRVVPRGLEINYISNTLRVGTYGRGMWEIGLPCLNKPEILEITQNTIWDSYMRLDRSVKVGSMAVLTITEDARIAMPTGAKIIIEPGGKMIVDGGTITSGCDLPWQGIEVWGNTALHQLPDINGNYGQGRVILNNATIENAVCAVNLWKPDDYRKTGGIVQATNSTFRDNAKSVHALLYSNYHPINGSPMEYNSSFKNCIFEITADYPGYQTFYKHIDLNQVNGLRFKGCDFSLSPDAQNVSDGNQAIAAYSSGFHVESICTSSTTPCSQYDSTTFTGFRIGVYAASVNSSNTFSINRAVFTGNTIGVLSNAVNNAIIINSDFYIAQNQYNREDCTYGIFVEAASNLTIEENRFFKQNGAPRSNYIGIGAFNCQTITDVYKNQFTGLTAGNYASGKNWKDRLYNGLEYICNTNTGNWADFYVTGLGGNQSGVQSLQGHSLMPARNTFSPTGARWHFYNETQNLIGYYYCQNCPGHFPEYVMNVTREPVAFSGDCPSHYGGQNPPIDIVLDATNKLNIEANFAVANLDLQGVKTLYNNLKDGGDTEGTISDLSSATTGEMWALRAKLLGDSPHLSTEVLKLVADRTDVFTETAIFDILAANPDELRKEELITYIEEKENPLPAYMVDILRQVAEGTTYRTVLELQLSKFGHERARAAGVMIRSILNEEELDVEQLRIWLSNMGGIDAERQIISTYVQQRDYAVALALAATLPAVYQLEGNDLLDHQQFVSLLQLQQNVFNSERTMEQLTVDEKDTLGDIVASETTVSSAMAKSILESFYEYKSLRCYPIEGETSYKSQETSPNQLATAYGLSIAVKPNPANDWVAFDYKLPEDAGSAILHIVDAKGKTIETHGLNSNRGQKLIDTRKWASGQYVYTLKAAGFIQSGKLIIVKQ